MAEAREAWSPLGTRIPKELHRRLKLYCVEPEVSVMDVVTEAVREKPTCEAKRSAPKEQ